MGQRPLHPRVLPLLALHKLQTWMSGRGRRNQNRVHDAGVGTEPVGERGEEPGAEGCRDRVVGHGLRHPLVVDVGGNDVPSGAADDDSPRPDGRGQHLHAGIGGRDVPVGEPGVEPGKAAFQGPALSLRRVGR